MPPVPIAPSKANIKKGGKKGKKKGAKGEKGLIDKKKS